MLKNDFAAETVRKERLLTLLEASETPMNTKFKGPRLRHGYYDRIFNGVAEISKIGKGSLRLKREGGGKLGVLTVTPEIAQLSKKGDHILATLGHRMGSWHLIQIQMIGSPVVTPNGETQMHLSGSSKALMTSVESRMNSYSH